MSLDEILNLHLSPKSAAANVRASSSGDLRDLFLRISRISVIVVCVITSLSLAGSLLGFRFPLTYNQYSSAPVHWTALCFLILGLSILYSKPRAPVLLRIAMGFASLSTFLLGVIGIADLVTPLDLDPLAQVASSQDVDTYLMSFNAAVCLILLSPVPTLLLHRSQTSITVVRVLAFTSGFIALLVGTAYIFGLEFVSVEGRIPPMAPLLTVMILLLSVSVLFSFPDRGLLGIFTDISRATPIVRRMILPIIAINLLLGWSAILLERYGVFASGVGIALLMVSNVYLMFGWIHRFASEINLVAERRADVERLLYRIVNSVPAAIYVRDNMGKVVLENSEYQRIRPFLSKQMNRSQKDENGHAVLNKTELESLEFEKSVETEATVSIRDEPRTYLQSTFPLFDGNHNAIGVCGLWFDITVKKRFQDLLVESQQNFRTLADGVPAIVWSADSDGKIDYFNKRWFEYTGLGEKESLGLGWTQVVHHEDLEQTQSAWAKSLKTGHQFSIQHRVLGADGIYRWHLVRGLPALLGSKKVQKWFGSSIDIDEQKKKSETLEKLVADRTQALLQSNRELEAFTYSVSHDLRAPLRSMDGFSQLLLEKYSDSIDETGKTYLNKVRNASRNMAGIIDDLLTLSRISRTEIVRENVDLSEVVRMLLEEKRANDSHRKVDIRIEPGITVLGDTSLLRIALNNLVENAWKYTSKKNQARIDFFSERKNDQRVFVVRDNGAGFDMQHADSLFKAFHRLHSAAEFPGTGIGLITVQRIVERHGGSIWAYAEPDKGASFYFTLEAEK